MVQSDAVKFPVQVIQDYVLCTQHTHLKFWLKTQSTACHEGSMCANRGIFGACVPLCPPTCSPCQCLERMRVAVT